MRLSFAPRRRRRAALIGAIIGGAMTTGLMACDKTGVVDPTLDTRKPSITLTAAPDAMTDSTIGWNAALTDNVGIYRASFHLSGGVTDSVFVRFTDSQTARGVRPIYQLPLGTPKGTRIHITGVVRDGAGNTQASDTLEVIVGLTRAPSVSITIPRTGSLAVVGRGVPITVVAQTGVRLRVVGLSIKGAMTRTDSMVSLSPLPDSLTFVDTLNIPTDADTGTVTITPFLMDSLKQRTLGRPITLTIRPPTASTTPPTVTFSTSRRIEATDTVGVRASDPTGIRLLGYELRDPSSGALILSDSVIAISTLTEQHQTLRLNLGSIVAPRTLLLSTFAVNGNGIRGAARLETGTVRSDTVLLIQGVTRVLPQGGQVADAIYHPRQNRLYLTNVTGNRVEVFNLADSSFKDGIIVGSRPWGIAAWPRNRAGDLSDTLLVANSGGTTIRYVNVAKNVESYRYALPNILLYTVKTIQRATTGTRIQQRTMYDFSDRPEFIATTCHGANGGCTEVLMMYSTTPTLGQSSPFANAGTARWENLTARTSHFMFEHAMGQAVGTADTVEIVRYAAQGVGRDSTLVPAAQFARDPFSAEVDSVSYTINLPLIGFRDTTFVRNSGDFHRAIFGEGGIVKNSRALMYDTDAGFVTLRPRGFPLPTPSVDRGVSRAGDVSDFIANTSTSVRGVSINFDGRLAAVRADSTYIIDPTLRLQGLLQTVGGNAGFDFHPKNTGYKSTPSSTRLAFAASASPVIEIYDTWCYAKVGEVQVRDPIIGPIKVASSSTGGLVLVGATKYGVVMVGVTTPLTTRCP